MEMRTQVVGLALEECEDNSLLKEKMYKGWVSDIFRRRKQTIWQAFTMDAFHFLKDNAIAKIEQGWF